MKKINCMAIVLLCSFGCAYAMDQQQLQPKVVVHKLTFGDTLKASFVLSMPVVTVLAGTCAYNSGLSLPMSIACSCGVGISYAVALKALLCSDKRQKKTN